MVHRSTPLINAFRSYVSGGARSVVASVDDSKLMQEMAGGFLAGESRQGVEAPQNYGFTSVTMDADEMLQNAAGMAAKASGFASALTKMSGMWPETFISFIGGSRAFAVAGNIDDRRHRLFNLAKGDVAMFRTKQDQLQLHLTTDGGFFSGPDSKTVRMQLVPAQQQQGSVAQMCLTEELEQRTAQDEREILRVPRHGTGGRGCLRYHAANSLYPGFARQSELIPQAARRPVCAGCDETRT